jgi:hypothetical protein
MSQSGQITTHSNMLKDLCAQTSCWRVVRDLHSKITAFMDDISFVALAFEQLRMSEIKMINENKIS